MITFESVTKRFPDGTVAADNLSFEVPEGELVVLVGPSGCGKTTALRMVNRMIEPTGGSISVNGQDTASVSAPTLRRDIGYVIQQVGLFPHLTVAANVATVPSLIGWDKERTEERVRELIDTVGLSQEVSNRYPRQLSGGQQQRVGVARALAADPPLLLMDEPFGAVDPVRRGALQQEFKRLQRDLGKTVVFVTHDVDEAVLLGDRIAIMREGGEVAQFGPPDALLAQPSDDFVASFIGDTRGLKLLSLRSASEVPATDVGPGGLGGWLLRTDDDGRPLTWRAASGEGTETPVERVGPSGSLRDLIDSAVASPARAAVRVDEDGRLVGAVPFATLEEHLPAPEIATEPQGAA